ncbi:hypothetical protein AN958_11002 [Leucoagaricus sp. SymC.cos]|nr:hypothetical protein AN958_11002 [Leucoagaricus sp. SymC.cos]
MPYFGQDTPYSGLAPFIPFSPYSQGLPLGSVGRYTPLPPVGSSGLSADYREYPNSLPPPTPLMGTPCGEGAPPVIPPSFLQAHHGMLAEVPSLNLPQAEGQQTHLRWNMLMESSLVHRSCDPLQVSWSAGRTEPTSFPHLTVLKIVSEHFPWLIEIKARDPNVGVTCGEVIEAIASSMDKLTSRSDYEALPNADFLGQMMAFGGLEVGREVGKKLCNVVVPGFVVLKCDKREFMTQEEVRAQQARERAASHAASVGRAGSIRSGRPGSAASSQIGIGVDVESPSGSEDEHSSSD